MMQSTTALDSLRISVTRVMIAQIVLVKRETLVVGSRRCPARWARFFAFDSRARRAFFIQTHANPFAAKAFLAEQSFDFDLTQTFAFEIGQLQIFEHQVDQFIQADIGLVIIDARMVARLLAPLPSLPSPMVCRACGSPSPP